MERVWTDVRHNVGRLRDGGSRSYWFFKPGPVTWSSEHIRLYSGFEPCQHAPTFDNIHFAVHKLSIQKVRMQ